MKVEKTLETHEDRLKRQENNNDVLVEMRVILENQIEVNKEQNSQMKEFSNTLINVNDNLTILNNNQIKAQEDIHKIGDRVNHIEKSQEASKIDLITLIKNILISAITFTACYFIYQGLGIK